jgi:CTP synthase (UTP-ammonia lyase)
VDRLRIGIIGDFSPRYPSHLPTNEAIKHAAATVGRDVVAEWVPTRDLETGDLASVLGAFNGHWIAPGSPYQSLEGALRGIQYVRERCLPLFGT